MVAMRNVTTELRAVVGGWAIRPELAALLILLAMVELGAQSVEGVVVDSADAPVVGAVVTLTRAGQDSASGSRTTTDGRGRFHFAAVSVGSYVLDVRLLGYGPARLAVSVPRRGIVDQRITLQRVPQVLARVRIVDQDACDATSLEGFECRRAAGVGLYRDRAELLAMEPRYWVELLDGMPGVRRIMRRGAYGPDWRVAPPPGRCIRELWNGQPWSPMDFYLKPDDVVAVEYYDRGRKVPAAYRRHFKWYDSLDCAMIIYWIRGAAAEALGKSIPADSTR